MVGAREPHPAFTRAYAVLAERFYTGPYPGEVDPETALEKLGFLYFAGVRAFVNPMEPHETDRAGKPFIRYEEALEGPCILF
ncbi:MAG TPA: hypothetical protein PK875_04990 [Spirochaetota bacterium]|jgi:hypothetical protein|nr:MAG: hypothetical protein BWY96_01644 [Spirochaetes bacterium ADurb.BinA120]HPI15332.1 hypothetical protein [Spirochaetota bacterium]HPO45132.1 hypothetical protein [Spirochaetota bacterium]